MGDPHGDPQTSPQHADPHGYLTWFPSKMPKSMWIGVLWAGLRVTMWITYVGIKFRHGLLARKVTSNSLEIKTGWRRNRTGTGNRNCRNHFVQEPKSEPEPFFKNRNSNRNSAIPLNYTEMCKKTLSQRDRRNRKPEPLEPFHARGVTELQRTRATLLKTVTVTASIQKESPQRSKVACIHLCLDGSHISGACERVGC